MLDMVPNVSTGNPWLVAAAALSGMASALHVAIIVGGAEWYRFFGAGEAFARAAESGEHWQDMVTAGIAAVLGLWAAYALSGAGIIGRLPLLRVGLVLITAVYLLRGAVLLPALVLSRPPLTFFVAWTSAISLAYGVVHLRGVVAAWRILGERTR